MADSRRSSWAPRIGEPDPTTPPLSPVANPSDHLLKVAESVTHDASQVWTELWSEFKGHISPNGAVLPEMDQGFVPSCGWNEFLDKFRLLKFHLDSVSRVCKRK